MPWSGLKRLFLAPDRRAESDCASTLVSPEEHQRELVVLGLSGRCFGAEDYAVALGEYLGVRISICVLAETRHPHIARMLATSGRMAQLSYSEDYSTAVVLVPSGLPPMVRTLRTYHELGHVAAGDPLEVWKDATRTGLYAPPSRRLARRPPLQDEELREREADLRAVYSVVAGSLGPDSPYAQEVYHAL